MKIVTRSQRPFRGKAQANFSAEGVINNPAASRGVSQLDFDFIAASGGESDPLRLKYVDVENGLATPHLGGLWIRSRSLMRNAG